MASNKTEAVVDFRGKGRQQVLEDLALEFPVVDGQWTPTVYVADGVLLRLVSTYRHLGTQASHGSTWHSLSASDVGAMEDTYMAPFRTIANERWRPGHVPASSQEVCRRLGILDFQEVVIRFYLRLVTVIISGTMVPPTAENWLRPLLYFELHTELDNLIAMQNLRTSANKGSNDAYDVSVSLTQHAEVAFGGTAGQCFSLVDGSPAV